MNIRKARKIVKRRMEALEDAGWTVRQYETMDEACTNDYKYIDYRVTKGEPIPKIFNGKTQPYDIRFKFNRQGKLVDVVGEEWKVQVVSDVERWISTVPLEQSIVDEAVRIYRGEVK